MASCMTELKDLELQGGSDVDEDSLSDEDLCDSEELNKTFSQSRLVQEIDVASDKYILDIAGTSESNPTIGIAVSDDNYYIFDAGDQEMQSVATLSDPGRIVESQFCRRNPDLVYTCCEEGVIKLWDIRAPQRPASTYSDISVAPSHKVFNSFDISANDKLLCAGTDLYDADAYLVFWDVRSRKTLGGYWESHQADVTQVRFDRVDSNTLISGSTDGLINIYDLSEGDESDALVDALNTESSVDQLYCYTDGKTKRIGCITHSADLQVWKTDDAQPSHHFRRSDIAKSIKRTNEEYTYVAGVHQEAEEDSLLVLAGSNVGGVFRGLRFANGKLQPACVFSENKQIVRSSFFNKHTNMLVTGGEKGLLNLWKTANVKEE